MLKKLTTLFAGIIMLQASGTYASDEAYKELEMARLELDTVINIFDPSAPVVTTLQKIRTRLIFAQQFVSSAGPHICVVYGGGSHFLGKGKSQLEALSNAQMACSRNVKDKNVCYLDTFKCDKEQ